MGLHLKQIKYEKEFLIPSFIAAGMILLFSAYWRVSEFPFIQDDWSCLFYFQILDFASLWQAVFYISEALFFRPLGQLYLYSLNKLFNTSPLPYHVIAVIIHTLSAYIVVKICHSLIRDKLVSYLIGFLYASAFAIHLDCLLWIVGIYDLGGQLCFLLGLLLFVRNRIFWSVVVYFIGCLFKESVVILPAVLWAFAILELRLSLKQSIRQIAPFSLPMCFVAAIKLMGQSPFTLAPSHPYVMQITGSHVLKNFIQYIAWLLQSIVPLPHAFGMYIKIALTALVVFSILMALRKRDAVILRRLCLFVVWLTVPLLTVIFLPNHTYRYYAVYSTPAFIAIFVMQINYLIRAVTYRTVFEHGLLIVLALGSMISSHYTMNIILNEGISQHTNVDGTNLLVARAAITKIVEKGLKSIYPTIPPPLILFFGNVDIWAFGKEFGPRVWYHTNKIEVYPLESLKCDVSGLYIENPMEELSETYTGPTMGKKYLDPVEIGVLKVINGELRRIDLDEVRNSICK